jgi:hypothetical protein
MKSFGLDDKPARDGSLLAALRGFDEARPSLPGEHWTAFGLGLYLLLRRRRTSAGRLASIVAGAMLVARALSGRDGAIAVLRRTQMRGAEGRTRRCRHALAIRRTRSCRPERVERRATSLTMKVDGSCHCGSVRYEAQVDPARCSRRPSRCAVDRRFQGTGG